MQPVKLGIVDDHKSVRDTFAYFLEQEHGIRVTVIAENGRQFLKAIKRIKVDVVLLDLQMKVLNGKETCKILSEKYPTIKVVAWTYHNEKEKISEMLTAGAAGFVCKECGVPEVLKALKAVKNGEIYISKKLKDDRSGTRAKFPLNSSNSFGISLQEAKVLTLLCEGNSGKEISNEMKIKYRTVESHKRNLFKKTGTRSAGKLVAFARSNGLVE